MMPSTNAEVLETNGHNIAYTVPLTEAAENGAITPDEYVRQRARIVGQGNILENLLIPLLSTFLRRYKHEIKAKP